MPIPRWLRRGLAPIFVVIELALLALCAIVAAVGLVQAPFSRKRQLLRVGTFGVAYFGMECVVLVATFVAWLTRGAHPRAWWHDYHYRLLRWTLGTILGAARRCCGFVVTLEEPPVPGPLSEPEPVLVLARHGGLGDSYSLVWMLLDRYDRRVRIVLKDMLQWEPLLDVILNRLDCCFLPAEARAGEQLASRLGQLTRELGPREALLVFPEGGNWTPGRWTRAIRRLHVDRKHRAATIAALMPHVLPPRPAGVLACLNARPGLAVMIAAHTGLDTLTSARQIWAAIPFTEPMTIRCWPPSAVPAGEEDRLRWLTTEWAVIDEWIDAHTPEPTGVAPTPED